MTHARRLRLLKRLDQKVTATQYQAALNRRDRKRSMEEYFADYDRNQEARYYASLSQGCLPLEGVA